LLANPTWNGEFHQVEWRWAYSWVEEIGDDTLEGFLRLLFRKPARGRQVDMSAVRGTITIGDNRGYFEGMKYSEGYGECCWRFVVDWYDQSSFSEASVTLYAGVVQDDEGNPLIGCGIPRLSLVGKRDCDVLTGEEEDILGVGLTGYEYKDYANEKYGKRYRYVDPDKEYSSEDDSEEMETDSGSNLD
jgi:hypothetical protein